MGFLNPFSNLSKSISAGGAALLGKLTKGKAKVAPPPTLKQVVDTGMKVSSATSGGINEIINRAVQGKPTSGGFSSGFAQTMQGTKPSLQPTLQATGVGDKPLVGAINTAFPFINPLNQNAPQYQKGSVLGFIGGEMTDPAMYAPAIPKLFSSSRLLPKAPTSLVSKGSRTADDIARRVTKERGFITTVKESPTTAKSVASKVEGTYTPITNKETLKRAQVLIAKDEQAAYSLVKNTQKPTADTYATAQALLNKFQRAGRYEEAIDLVDDIARKATEQGQAIQSLAMYNKLTPEGALRYAQRKLSQLGQTLTPEQAKAITDQANKLKSIPEGRLAQIEAARLQQLIDPTTATIGQKVSTAQTAAQLLNPKTPVRNVMGNAGFQAAENVSGAVASPIDYLLSKVTGKRTRYLPSLTTQAKGFFRGAKEGIEDVRAGVNTLPNVTSQFDLPAQPIAKTKIGKFFEKALGYELRVPDRAFYQSAYDDALRMQMKAAGVKQATPEMMELADIAGKYRTFQDSNALSELFTRGKSALNMGKKFGLGDFVLKYPKTPANLLARGIDYSPAGAIKGIIEVGKAIAGKGFNQGAFVDAVSRSAVGTTGMVGLGYYLHDLGLITPGKDENKKVAQLQEETGAGPYRLNLSGIKRFLMSGFDPDQAKMQKGDTLVSYDWFQPAAINFAIGANLSKSKGDKALNMEDVGGITGMLAEATTAGTRTLEEQPLVQGLKRLFGYGDITGGLGGIAEAAPASFIPTVLNQVRQLLDNTRRNTYDPNPFKESMNRVKYRIPGLSQNLPPQIGTFGEEKELYQGGTNNPFNVFLNPAFVSKYQPTSEQDLALDIYKQSGETEHIPTQANKVERGKTLSTQEMTGINRLIGQGAKTAYGAVSGAGGLNKASPRSLLDLFQGINKKVKDGALDQTLSGASDRATTIYTQVKGMPPDQMKQYLMSEFNAGRISTKEAKQIGFLIKQNQ